MNDGRALAQVIEDVYAAALEPARWSATTERLAGYVDAPSGIAILTGSGGAVVLGHTANTDAAARKDYEQIYCRLDPWAAAHMRHPIREVYFGDELVDPRVLRESEFYRDHVRHHGIFHCLGCTAPLGPGATIVLAVHRPIEAAPFDIGDKIRLAHLLPHLERAAQVQRALAAADVQRMAALEALERLALGIVLLNTDGYIMFANTTAEVPLRDGDALTTVAGRLTARSHEAALALQHAIDTAVLIGAGRLRDPDALIRLQRADKRPLSILVAPLAATRSARLFTGAAVVVFIADPERRRRLPAATLARLYHLTAAEARLLQALLAGEHISDYADHARISTATVRTQLRNLFDKTETNRQSDLIALALRDLAAWLTEAPG